MKKVNSASKNIKGDHFVLEGGILFDLTQISSCDLLYQFEESYIGMFVSCVSIDCFSKEGPCSSSSDKSRFTFLNDPCAHCVCTHCKWSSSASSNTAYKLPL